MPVNALCSVSLAEGPKVAGKQQEFTPKLSDFSSSCKADETVTNAKIITPSHTSPEQFMKVKPQV